MAQKNTDKKEVCYLPAFSPELHPDEYMNNDLKQAVHSNYGGVAQSKEAIQERMVSQMRPSEKSSEIR